ncbi:Thymidylate kinase [Actinomyces bovis]|uniref:Thymidylate kinase n=1 Tax=Actinomyces bovis TaxID=1658 RepID=A0ABY1VRG9_9ACTO|nr:dTMP kinase [Actinomyces bovis]SPT54261.1 Thymidylate kinase [Actinomyces bovis]VEG56432.1 Thymidylate kinase [Actinomyces israelii]
MTPQPVTGTPLADPRGENARPGLFITFEGGDGVGKTTQIGLLAERLRQEGCAVVTTREPGGTPLGQEIRQLLLHGGEVSPHAEALLYAADRAHHVDTVIRPALGRGAVVVCDRYLDSSVAYQGAARALGPKEVRDLSLWATGGLLPDLTILLDVDPGLAGRRTKQRGAKDRLEREPDSFHIALREQFLALAAAEPQRVFLVDAGQSIAEVAAEVNRLVAALLKAKGGGVCREAGTTAGVLQAFAYAAARISPGEVSTSAGRP